LDEQIQPPQPVAPGVIWDSSVIPAKAIVDLIARYRRRTDTTGDPRPAGPATTEVFQLRKHDVVATANSLKALFPGTRASVAPQIEANVPGRRLLIRGRPEQITQIRELLKKMGEDDLGGP